MLDQILKELNNHFITSAEYTTLTISGAEITGFSETYLPGQYVNIDGSILNDGTYKILSNTSGVITLTEDLIDESNVFYMYGLAIPKSVIELSTKVSTYSATATSGLASESQGSRSVSYQDGSSWESVFKKELNSYRKAISDKERWFRCGRQTRLYYKQR